jgi:all-trans-8'-apo-beta-carotenal 15,15'-oxygenase
VTFLGDELYALWEGGSPFQIDPATLETIGESTLYGAVDGKQNTRYAAHYKVDPRNGNMCGFSICPGDNDPANTHKLCVMEHSPTKEMIYQKSFPFDGLGVSHDCAITENYFVFLQSPFDFKPLPFILGQKGVSECIIFDTSAETANIVLIPRGDNAIEPIIIPVPPFFSFHTSNAFEDVNGEVVLDLVVAKSEYKQFAAALGDDKNGYPERPIWETLDWKTDVPANEMLRVRLDPNQIKMISQTPLTNGCAT